MKPIVNMKKMTVKNWLFSCFFFLETLKLPPYQISNEANIVKNVYLITSSLCMMDSS